MSTRSAWESKERLRGVSAPRPRLRVLVATLVCACVVAVITGRGSAAEPQRTWTKFPPPPEIRDGVSVVWAGTRLLLFGGCAGHKECRPARDGFSFDPSTEQWHDLPLAPRGAEYASSVWTGTEAIFFDDGAEARLQPGFGSGHRDVADDHRCTHSRAIGRGTRVDGL